MRPREEEDEEDEFDPNQKLFEVVVGIVLPLCLVLGLEMLYREPLLDVSRRTIPQV